MKGTTTMQRCTLLTLLLIMFTTLFSGNYLYAKDDNDWRLMLYQHVSKDINKNNALTLYIEEGRKDSIKTWEYIMPDIGWKHKTSLKYMPAVSLSYRHVYIRSHDDEWDRDEERYNFNMFFKLPDVKNLKLRNRLRFEYRDKKAFNNWRIRNVFAITFPLSWTKYKITPHLVDEIRYSFEQDQVSMNEVWLKLTARFTKNTVTCFGYRWGWLNTEPDWSQYHMLTLGISILLP